MVKANKGKYHKQKRELQCKEGLQYFPDDYFEWMFSLGIPEDIKEETTNEWYSDYMELMEYRRNPRIGRTKCFHCLLSPDAEDSTLFIGINKVLSRALEDGNNYNNSKKDNSSSNNNPSSFTTAGTSIYPCKVLNRYACPYDNKGDKLKVDANLMSMVFLLCIRLRFK